MKQTFLAALLLIALTLSGCGAGQRAATGGISGAESTMQDNETPPDSSQTQPQEPAPGETPVIRAVVGKNCNYVYHMLAVSGCGYLNAYGETYKALHPDVDLQLLKNNEIHLTVSGGEHQGELYFLCVALPASLDDETSVQAYYQALADLFAGGDLEQNYQTYHQIYQQAFSPYTEVTLDSFYGFYSENEALKEEIAAIAAVMGDNYDIYIREVWAQTLAELSVAAAELNHIFAAEDYESGWEQALGHKYSQDAFLALLCNSMENGPNAINIAADKDVFYVSEDSASTAKFISHEFGIFLLMDILADTDAFHDFAYYKLAEGLAEYFNTAVSGGLPNWNAGEEYIAFYRQLREDDPEITAKEMFQRGVEAYMPASQ